MRSSRVPVRPGPGPALALLLTFVGFGLSIAFQALAPPRAAADPLPILACESAPDPYLATTNFVIGRSSSCNLALDDGLVSRRHALLRVTENDVTVSVSVDGGSALEQSIPEIAAGATGTASIPLTPAPSGQVTLDVVVDAVPGESITTNNEASYTVDFG